MKLKFIFKSSLKDSDEKMENGVAKVSEIEKLELYEFKFKPIISDKRVQ